MTLRTIKDFYSLAKPGIVYGNALVAAGGFFLASRGSVDFALLAATLAGLSAIIAAGCVFNNYIDRDIDVQMERTKERVLVTGAVTARQAIVFGLSLLILGSSILAAYTNALALSVALFGFFAYVVLYSVWSKRYSAQATLVGSISGAVPPVVGYCAVSNTLDPGAAVLFLTLCAWQIPHAYAIAIYRLSDYAAASIPVLPLRAGIRTTKIHMLAGVLAFVILTLSLAFLGYTGSAYAIAMSTLGALWLILCIRGFRAPSDATWARMMFILSLIAIVTFSLLLSLTGRIA